MIAKSEVPKAPLICRLTESCVAVEIPATEGEFHILVYGPIGPVGVAHQRAAKRAARAALRSLRESASRTNR